MWQRGTYPLSSAKMAPAPFSVAKIAHQTPDVSPPLGASNATPASKANNDDVSHSSKRSLPASSAAQPESKKGTTTIASQMKDSLVDLFESDNEDDAEESGVEGASRPTGVQSEWWKYF